MDRQAQAEARGGEIGSEAEHHGIDAQQECAVLGCGIYVADVGLEESDVGVKLVDRTVGCDTG